MVLIVELRMGGQWIPLQTLEPGTMPGSLSHNGPAGRQIYQFTCHGAHSIIRRSVGGVDFEEGPIRMIASDSFEEVARLDATHPSEEIWIRTDRMRQPQRLRFRHE